MLIDQNFIDDFAARVRTANGDKERLTAAAGMFEKNSSMRPIYNALVARLNTNLDWAAAGPIFNPLFTALGDAKQRKYADPIKFLIKSIRGDGSHMFHSLHSAPHNLSVKLSKAQQRFNIAVAEGNAGHGLCMQMAMLWLKEQLARVVFRSDFPRLADSNVLASERQKAVTTTAITNYAITNATDQLAPRLGLVATRRNNWDYGFDNVHNLFTAHPEVNALIIFFFGGGHVVALFREPAGSFLFYDANCGSYRIQANNLPTFLQEYNDVCLPLKWPGQYNYPVSTVFTGIFTIRRA